MAFFLFGCPPFFVVHLCLCVGAELNHWEPECTRTLYAISNSNNFRLARCSSLSFICAQLLLLVLVLLLQLNQKANILYATHTHGNLLFASLHLILSLLQRGFICSRECIVVVGKGEPPEARVDSLDLMGCASPRLRGNWFRRRNCCHCLKLPPEVTRSIFTTQFSKMHSASVGTYSIYFKVSSLTHSVSSCPRLILLKLTLNYVLSI